MKPYFKLRVLAYLFLLASMVLVVSTEHGSGDASGKGSGVNPDDEEWSGMEDFKMEEVWRKLCVKPQKSMERVRLHFDEDSKVKCPHGFYYLPEVGSCYQFIFERRDWTSADLSCRKVNPKSHLVAVETANENIALSSYIDARIETNPRIFDCVDHEPSGRNPLNLWTAMLLRNDSVRGFKSLAWQLSPEIAAQPVSHHPHWNFGMPPPCPPGDEICLCSFESFLGGERSSELQSEKTYCFLCEYDPPNNQNDKKSSKPYY